MLAILHFFKQELIAITESESCRPVSFFIIPLLSAVIRVSKSGSVRWTVHVARMGEKCVMGFGGEAWEKRPPGRSRHRWEDNIKKNLKIGWEGVDWICVAREKGMWWNVVITVTNFRVP